MLWLLPVAALWLLAPESVFTAIALFSFETCRAELWRRLCGAGLVAQAAVTDFGWLRPTEMLDGLGMAETTPGPLIMVLQFVGFMAAFRSAGWEARCWRAVWAGFWPAGSPLPLFCLDFPWGAFHRAAARQPCPWRGAFGGHRGGGGVIANLALWFALHLLWRGVTRISLGPVSLDLPQMATLDLPATGIAAVAVWALFRRGWGMAAVLAGPVLAFWRIWPGSPDRPLPRQSDFFSRRKSAVKTADDKLAKISARKLMTHQRDLSGQPEGEVNFRFDDLSFADRSARGHSGRQRCLPECLRLRLVRASGRAAQDHPSPRHPGRCFASCGMRLATAFRWAAMSRTVPAMAISTGLRGDPAHRGRVPVGPSQALDAAFRADPQGLCRACGPRTRRATGSRRQRAQALDDHHRGGFTSYTTFMASALGQELAARDHRLGRRKTRAPGG
ncbi:chromate transporter [Rhodobacter capsulatus]|uniref:chromate transporter n=1 Tax=Rhodobacter capsulatus TaxID=1061 RepID=UPI004025D942